MFDDEIKNEDNDLFSKKNNNEPKTSFNTVQSELSDKTNPNKGQEAVKKLDNILKKDKEEDNDAEDIFADTDPIMSRTMPQEQVFDTDITDTNSKKRKVIILLVVCLLVILFIVSIVIVINHFRAGSDEKNIDTKKENVIKQEDKKKPEETPEKEENKMPTDFNSKDTDKDKITDIQEEQAGTSIYDADTDRDGLSDYDELFLYQTNPKDNDSDGDGYLDGEEIKGGYNPNGEGKLRKK